ncbi:PIN domain-containing protein [Mammaliicoccus sciuri]|uniref:PIN domain-containing protein n=1 Tax=Mammaliicoccus sciuri TaxID=1296 RepID=UPI001299CEB8|nr:PIN domain-containing protein [Mammaliicoccus sciuri]MRE73091.1 hypothetical protein [Mammaliicoccus sciuri]
MQYIILDTNILHNRDFKDYYNFELKNSYTDLQGRIERKDLANSFKILIPDLVFKELHKQKLQKYEADFIQLNLLIEKFNKFLDVKFELPPQFEYEEFLEQKISEFKVRNSIETIKTINNNETFAKIIDKAVNKKPPFEGKESKSDKGFKDALIWESILNFAQNNPGKYYFCSKDKGFKNTLIEEFNNLTSNSTIEFITDNEQNFFNQLIDNLSKEKISSNRLKSIRIEIAKKLPELKNHLEENVFNTFSINNIPNYKLESFDFPEHIYELTDISNSSFTFNIYCNLKAFKTGSTISINIDLNFLVNTMSNDNTSLKSIELEGINAQTQDDDELILNVNLFKLDFVKNENYSKPDSTEKTTHSSTKKFSSSNEIKELDHDVKSIVNHVLSDCKVEIYTTEILDALYKTIAYQISVDWVHFESKISAMNLSIKKFLLRNNFPDAQNLTNRLVTSLKKYYLNQDIS